MLVELDDRITMLLSHMELQVTDVDDLDLYGRPDPNTYEMNRDPNFLDSMGDTVLMDGEPGGTGLNPVAPISPLLLRQSADEVNSEDPATWGKVGRNAPCPCGSEKKYKYCHGAHLILPN